MIHGCWGT